MRHFTSLHAEWPALREAAGRAVFTKARVIQWQVDALTAVQELFHFSYWLARTYARGAKLAPGLTFKPKTLPMRRASTSRPAQISPRRVWTESSRRRRWTS